MMCQYCGENEANNTFLVNFMGQEREVHLCDECTHKAKAHYEAVRRQGGGFPAWGNEPPARPAGESPFPLVADGQLRHRRKLNELHVKLRQAVNAERYEEAARLRDEIAGAEKDVFAI